MAIKRSERLQREGGFILITMYLLLAVCLVLLTATITHSFAEIRASQRLQSAGRAFYLAEAGVDQALSWIRAQGAPPVFTDERMIFPNGITQPLGPPLVGNDPGPLTAANGWRPLGGGGLGFYRVSIDPDNNNPVSFIDRYVLQGWGATGILDQATNQIVATSLRRTRFIVQTTSFSQYAWFTNAETNAAGTPVWFITGARIDGPAHTNGRFNIFGGPVFNGPVSSVAPALNLWGGLGPPTNNPQFNGGLRLGVQAPPMPFPTAIPAPLVNAAGNGGRLLKGNTQITLLADGTMQVTNAASGFNNTVLPLPVNGVLYVQGGDVTLQGTLNGQMTIATDQNVRIANPVTYASNPQVDPNSDDLLGIVAGRNVIVAQNAPQNMRIDGSVMALNTSFTVENYTVGPPKGALTVWGGIIQNRRGPIGTFNSGGRVSGYIQDYHYDNRLLSIVPPFFPTTGDYTPIVWEDRE